MQSNISYNARPTLNKNKIFIMKDNQNLKEVLSKFIKIDKKYNKLLKEIGKNINNKKVEHIDIMINLPPTGTIVVKVFVVVDGIGANDYRELGIKIHNYTVANGINDFDIASETNGESLFNILEGLLIMNYKFSQHMKRTSKDSHINYNISLLGRDVKEQLLMKKHLNILENMINSVSDRIKRENLQVSY